MLPLFLGTTFQKEYELQRVQGGTERYHKEVNLNSHALETIVNIWIMLTGC